MSQADLFSCAIRDLDPPQGMLDMAIDILLCGHDEPYSTILVSSGHPDRYIVAMQDVYHALHRLNYFAQRVTKIGGTIS